MKQQGEKMEEFVEYPLPPRWHKSPLVAGALSLVERLESKGYIAYWAGGAVRDLLLAVEPKDIDVATSAPPEAIESIFRKTLAVGKEFGVMVVLVRGYSYEVATFRTDKEYRDSRHPSGVVFSQPQEDALRRDFSINGLFYDPLRCYIIDYVGGVAALKEQKIQTIGNPHHRFQEDNLRLLRAVRFATRLRFAIEERTWSAIRELEGQITRVSRERIKEEFEKIFAVDSVDAACLGVDLLHSSNLLYRIFPFLASDQGFPRVIQNEQGERFLNEFLKEQISYFFDLVEQGVVSLSGGMLVTFVWVHIFNFWAKPEQLVYKHLLEGFGEQVGLENMLTNMRFSNNEKNDFVSILKDKQIYYDYDSLPLGEQKRLLRDELFGIKVAFVASLRMVLDKDSGYGARLLAARAQYSKEELWPPPLLTGKDLIRFGMKPGPHFAEILYRLESKQLAGELVNGKQAWDWLTQEYGHFLERG